MSNRFGSFSICTFFVVVAAVATSGCSQETKVSFQLDDTDVPSAVFTPDSKYIVAGGYRRISLLDIAGRKLIGRFPEEKRGNFGTRWFEVVAVSPDGKYVATAGGVRVEEMPVKIWEFKTGKLLQTFNTNSTQIRSLTFSPDGKQLAAATSFRLHEAPKPYEPIGEIWLWDITKENKEPIRFQGHAWAVEDIVFLPDGKRMISVGIDLTLRLWDIQTQKELKRSSEVQASLKAPPKGSRFDSIVTDKTLSLKISNDGKHLMCGRSVWDTENLKIEFVVDGNLIWNDFDKWFRFSHPTDEPFTDEEKPRKILSIFACHYHSVLTSDNNMLVVDGIPPSENSKSTIFIYDFQKGNLLYEDQVFGTNASVFALDVSPDGRYALAGGNGIGAGSGGGAPIPRDPNQLYLYRLPPPTSTLEEQKAIHQDADKAKK